MGILDWQRFTFFKVSPFMDSTKLGGKRSEIITHCYCRLQKLKFFCDSFGYIHVFLRNWDKISFQSQFKAIKLCAVADDGDIFVVLQQSSSEISLQIMDIKKITKRNGAPVVSVATIQTIHTAISMRVFSIKDQLCIAIGLANGQLVLSRSFITRDISASFHVIDVTSNYVYGIEFVRRNENDLCIFLCSNTGIFSYTLTENYLMVDSKTILDTTVGFSQCFALSSPSDFSSDVYLLVARDDAVYFYTTEGRGPCFAINGKKRIVRSFENYLLIVMDSPDTDSKEQLSYLIVIDIDNKLIVYNKYSVLISTVIVEDKTCYILTSQKEILILRERDLKTKIRLLLKKNLFDTALKIIGRETSDMCIGNINFEHGNYLLLQDEADKATDKYLNTIGAIESSNVIRRLMKSKYNRHLELYLHELIQKGSASEEHRTLHRNCSARLQLSHSMDQMCEGITSDKTISGTIDPFLIYRDNHLNGKLYEENADSEEVPTRMDELYVNLQALTDYRYLVNILKPKKNEPILETNIPQCLDFVSLIPTSSDAIIFLEKLYQFCASPKKTISQLLLHYYLRHWNDLTKSTEDVIQFLKTHENWLNFGDIIIYCRNNNFWNGIVFVCERNGDKNVNLELMIHRFYFKMKAKTTWDSYTKVWPHIGCDENNKLCKPFDNLQQFLVCLFSKQRLSLLHTVDSLYMFSDIDAKQVRYLFLNKHSHFIQSYKALNDVGMLSYSKLKRSEDLYTYLGKYPIEYRCNTCCACKKELKFPIVYFLCQHSFHKECLSFQSVNRFCMACENTKSLNSEDILAKLNDKDNNIFRNISPIHKLSLLFEARNLNFQMKKANPANLSSSSVKELYDSNLNPFDN